MSGSTGHVKESSERIAVNEKTLYIIGIGASAGGLQALEEFFGNAPPNSGLAYIVVQHLSPHYKSVMNELLSKFTQMPIVTIQDGTVLEANHIYLLPPRQDLTLTDYTLHLKEASNERGINLSIDSFFESLAEQHKERAVAVILSGTGSDGTQGVRDIRGAGGMVIIQSPDNAKFDGMPRSAISTRQADFIRDASEMAECILSYVNSPVRPKSETLTVSGDGLQMILGAIKHATRADFSHYRKKTLLRRIEKRMSVCRIAEFQRYVQFVCENVEEAIALFQDALIGVTRFFRDKKAFDLIKGSVLPTLFETKAANKVIRVWSVGCSTGEEPYSLAMLFQDYIDRTKSKVSVKIFATDLNKEALRFASAGVYPENITADVSDVHLGKYFSRNENGFTIDQEIRNKVIFSGHNILQDPPFNRVDLIVCRNLLIYFDAEAQRKILSFFSFALNTGGFLCLGKSESVADLSNYYKTLNYRWKIYKLTGKSDKYPNILELGVTSSEDNFKSGSLPSRFLSTPKDRRGTSEFRLYREVIGRYGPPSVLVNDNHTILATFGDADRYFKLPVGKIQYDLFEMARHNLSVIFGTIMHKVKREGKRIEYRGISIGREEDKDFVDIYAEPFTSAAVSQDLYFICISPSVRKTIKKTQEKSLEFDQQQHLQDLELELQYTKENLQATIEELETSNEELQVTNEELLSSNEELQSTNEELHSVNEELITVNTEYMRKIDELKDLNNDVNNLLQATFAATLFLDSELRIRKFTPAVTEVLDLIESDVGRNIKTFAFQLDYGEFVQDIEEVRDTLKTVERETLSKAGHTYLIKISPYRTVSNIIKGVVVTFFNMSRDNGEATSN